MTHIYTRSEIEKVIRPLEVIQAIEEGFVAYSQGKVVVPPVGHLDFPDEAGDCHIKYGYVRGGDTFTVKIATGFFRNLERGLPSGDGVILVFSSKTGALLAILQDKAYLTDVRTAAAGAVAAKYLAPSKIERIGILGAGVQARLQLEYLKPVTSCRKVSLWNRSLERAHAFRMEGFEIEVKRTVAELAAECQLIVTTTAATHWLLGAQDVRPGTHITALGADGGGKQELDPQLFRRAAVCAVDSLSQCAQFGDSSYALKEGIIHKEQLVELGKLILDRNLGRKDDQQITIADLTGVAIQDIQIANLALDALGYLGNQDAPTV